MYVEYLLLRVMCVLMYVHVPVGVNVSVIMCILVWIHVYVCVAVPIVVGVWPMAGTLWLLFEYYYYLLVSCPFFAAFSNNYTVVMDLIRTP